MNALTTASSPVLAPGNEAEAIRVLGNSLYPGAKPESIALVLSYCRINNLDPMLKPVHIVPTSVKVGHNKYEYRDVLMPGIADYRIKAHRSGEYLGKIEPEFGPDVDAVLGGVRITYPRWCKVVVKRLVQGRECEFVATEFWLENYATAGNETDAPNRMWRKRPYAQLAKCAEAQALRMAFPEFSGGAPTAEEMEGKPIDEFSGPTIDGKASNAAYKGPVDNRSAWVRQLEARLIEVEADAGKWLALLESELANAPSKEDIEAAAQIYAIKTTLDSAPSRIKQRISDALTDAYARFAEAEKTIDGEEGEAGEDGWDDLQQDPEPIKQTSSKPAARETKKADGEPALSQDEKDRRWIERVFKPEYIDGAGSLSQLLEYKQNTLVNSKKVKFSPENQALVDRLFKDREEVLKAAYGQGK